ncbi:4-alpha-glucanotransferase [Kamptonema cortianum]|nr:4-alpha-glucanotransferase [Kamptonema cortianum]
MTSNGPGGAPPESFFKGDPFTEQWGQNWGIPLYHWEANARGQFAWWRKRVELTCRVFNHFRIDHVLGFFRIYAFPWEPERNGEFVGLSLEEAAEKTGGKLPGFREHPDEPNQLAMKNAMQGLRLLEKIRQFAGDQGVVAEDLGVVPFYVSAILEDLKIPGFTIPIFIRDEETRDFLDPVEYPQISLVTFATHDHQPMASYYKELTSRWIGPEGHDAWLDLQRLGKLLRLDFDGENSPPTEFTPEIHEAMVRLVLENHCWLAVFMITDLVGTTQRFNEPGISADSNWSQRLDTPLGQWAADPLTGPKLRQFAQWVRQSGRAGASTDTCSLQQDIAD